MPAPLSARLLASAVLCAGAVLTGPVAAQAQMVPEMVPEMVPGTEKELERQAHAALSAAVDAATLEGQDPRNRFAFTQTIRSEDDFEMVVRFDPTAAHTERWRVLSPAPSAQTKGHEQVLKELAGDTDADLDLLLGDARNYAADCQHQADAPADVWRFACAAPSGDDDDFDGFEDKIVGVIEIDRASGLLASYRLYAREAFKPAPVAKVEVLDIRMSVDPAWSGGPLMISRVEELVSGSALFRPFSQQSVTIISQVERVVQP